MFIKLICVPCVLFPIDDFPEPNQPKKKKKKKKKNAKRFRRIPCLPLDQIKQGIPLDGSS
jgi:hypothetical protein